MRGVWRRAAARGGGRARRRSHPATPLPQEDAHIAQHIKDDWHIFGVFDGHGGPGGRRGPATPRQRRRLRPPCGRLRSTAGRAGLWARPTNEQGLAVPRAHARFTPPAAPLRAEVARFCSRRMTAELQQQQAFREGRYEESLKQVGYAAGGRRGRTRARRG